MGVVCDITDITDIVMRAAFSPDENSEKSLPAYIYYTKSICRELFSISCIIINRRFFIFSEEAQARAESPSSLMPEKVSVLRWPPEVRTSVKRDLENGPTKEQRDQLQETYRRWLPCGTATISSIK